MAIIPAAALVAASWARSRAEATVRKVQASRLIAVQRCQEVQVVTWPLSSLAACFACW
jgi:hypothetical protein